MISNSPLIRRKVDGSNIEWGSFALLPFSTWNASLMESVVIYPTEVLLKIILLPDPPFSDNSNGCSLTDMDTG